MRSSVIAAALLAACAQAIKVTSPTKDQVIDLSAGFKVTFDTVSTDPTSAHLFLVNMAGGNTPYSKDLGEVDLTKPFVVTEEDVPAQKGYQFNVQSVSKDNSGILAQSEQFEVKPADKKNVKSTATRTTATTTGAASSTGVTPVSSATGTASADSDADASGSSSTFATVTGTGAAASSKPTASSTSVSEAAAPTGKAVAGGSILALAVAGLAAVMA